MTYLAVATSRIRLSKIREIKRAISAVIAGEGRSTGRTANIILK
jgi:hypothetical protein